MSSCHTANVSAAAAASTASAAVASASDAASPSPPSLSASPTATPSLASAYKRKRFNSSAEDLVELLSPALQPTASKHSRHAINHPPPIPSSSASSSTAVAAAVAAAEAAAVESVRRAVYIQLAAESPHRSDVESEDSMYGSFHACETDVCRDTSDTDSYSTDEFATLDVLEYEIPSDSSTNEELYSHDSSSGTDDFVVTAAQLARAIFASQQSSSSNNSDNNSKADSPERRSHDGDGAGADCASTEFELFADTEESDAATDPELGRADYWTCVKCKNRQNNPMYRYCERCYQIRKTHFPPRPKLQKTRSPATAAFGGRTSAPTSQQQLQQRGYDGTTDDEDECDGGTAGTSNAGSAQQQLMRLRQQRTAQRRTRSRRQSATVATVQHHRRTASNSAADDSDEAHQSAALSDADMFNTQSTVASVASQRRTTTQPDAAGAPSHGATPPTHLPLFTTTLDSGFQSSSASAADLTPDAVRDSLLLSSDRTRSSAAALVASSQETYCSDVDARDDAASRGGGAVSVAVTGSSSTLSNVSSLSGLLSVTRSVSSCSATSHLDDCYDPDETGTTLDASGTAAATAAESSVVVAPPTRRCVFSRSPPLPSTAGSTSPVDVDVMNTGATVTASGSGASLVSSSSSGLGAAAAVAAAAAAVATAAAEDVNGMCMMCLTEPKNGVFVHSRFLHLCCCYRCAVKVWNKQKRCPICNCKVKNVMKLFVH